jgi:hypothetical protein
VAADVHAVQNTLHGSHTLVIVFPKNPVGQVAGQVLFIDTQKCVPSQAEQFVDVPKQAVQFVPHTAQVFAVLLKLVEIQVFAQVVPVSL